MAEEREITLKEAAAIFNVSHSNLRLLARKGKIPAQKKGRDWFTTEEAVAAYLQTAKRGRPPRS